MSGGYPLAIGDVVSVGLPGHLPPGREQEGPRPAIVAGLPGQLGPARFRMLVIVPVTTDRAQAWAAACPALYPRVGGPNTGLSVASIALLDQVRSVDFTRVQRRRGALSAAELQPIQDGLRRLLGL